MNIKFKIKNAIMLAMMKHKRKSEPFDGKKNDVFQLPPEAGPQINNSYYFGGNHMDGTSLILRLGMRNPDFREVFVIYVKPDGTFYGTERQQYTAADCPLHVECIDPEKHFKVWYDGQINDMKTGELLPCQFHFDYYATMPIHDHMQHSDFRGMAQAYARAKWNKEFFKESGGETGMDGKAEYKLTQRHYEQIGKFVGSITVDGQEQSFDMPAHRDRAFGKRDWNNMDDHIWLVGQTEDGEGFNFSTVSYPKVKQIFCGYSNVGFDKNYSLIDFRVLKGDFSDGVGPEVFEVECTFNNGKTVLIRAIRQQDLITTFDNGNYYFHEGVGEFEINGIKARGSIEYGWNKDKSRWMGPVIK